jgi:hypothetical protein
MENNELSNTCDYCDQELTSSPWFTLKACRYEGSKVNAHFRMQMCRGCYPKIHEPIRKAAFELMRQSFQNAIAKIKQDLRSAGEI